MKVYTPQEMFDIAARGILAQGCKSLKKGDRRLCEYRSTDDDGNVIKCAVGHMIPDHLYIREMDANMNLMSVLKRLAVCGLKIDGEVAASLQSIHDGAPNIEFIAGWKRDMIGYAKRMNLNAAVFDKKTA